MDNLQWSSAGLHIRQTRKYGIRMVSQLSELDGVGEIQDMAIAQHGRVLLLDEQANVWSFDPDNHYHEPLFPLNHGLFGKSSMLVTMGEMLIIADPDSSRRVSAYSKTNGQTYWTAAEHLDDLPLSPIAMTADDKYIYVVTPLEVFAADNGRPIAAERSKIGIVRLDGAGRRTLLYTDEKCRIKQQVPIYRMQKRFYCAVSASRELSLFDSEDHMLYIFGEEGTLSSRIAMPPLQFAGLSVDSMNQFYIGDSRHIADEGEDDRFVLNLGTSGELITKVAGYRGKVDKLLLDPMDRMLLLNNEEGTLTVLELQLRTLEQEFTGRIEGVYLSASLDSTEAETVWHKLLLDADIPDETQIRISYFSSDREIFLVNGEPVNLDAYITDSSISLGDKLKGLAPYWSEPILNPTDALLFRAQGRRLWLKVDWIGSERKTPLIRKLRVYFPRTSYLEYLPAVYREDTGGGDFLERFLSLFETMFQSVEEQISGLDRYFDSDLVGGPYLKWLSTWLGGEPGENWSEPQIRRLIQEAPELYKYRGTRKGLEKMIEIYTGETPFIIEHFQYEAMRDNGEFRELVDTLYGSHPNMFSVIIKPDLAPTEKQRMMLQSILDGQKPAFTEARLILLQPLLYLNLHSYLGINSQLTEPSLLKLDPQHTMPNSTLLVDLERDRRLDSHTRLEMDSELD